MEEGFFNRKILQSLVWSLLCHILAYASIDLPSSNTTYVQKGGKFILLCRVPLSGIHLWYKDGIPIVPNATNKYHLRQDPPTFSRQGFEYFMTMRLIVEQAQAIHTGKYKCNNFSPYSEEVIVVTANMIETNEDEPGTGKLMVVGKELLLQCNTTQCRDCKVVWYKDSEPLVSVENRLTINDDDNSVIIQRATYDDSGTYTCAIDREMPGIALNASIVVRAEVKLERFESASDVVVQGSALELHCIAKGAPKPIIKWFKGNQEINGSHQRIKIFDHKGIENGKLLIEEADYGDRDHYTCEAYNQVNSANTTVFIRIKDRLAALWPFLGICIEVAILCSIIFVYEKRKSSQSNEADTDLPTANRNPRDQAQTRQDVRRRN